MPAGADGVVQGERIAADDDAGGDHAGVLGAQLGAVHGDATCVVAAQIVDAGSRISIRVPEPLTKIPQASRKLRISKRTTRTKLRLGISIEGAPLASPLPSRIGWAPGAASSDRKPVIASHRSEEEPFAVDARCGAHDVAGTGCFERALDGREVSASSHRTHRGAAARGQPQQQHGEGEPHPRDRFAAP